MSSHRFDLAIATWWRTFFDLWKVQADRYAYFVQSIESRFYPLEERVVRAAVDATYDAPLGIITEAPWIRDYFRRLYGRDAGLAVHLRFTPTYSSWLNQVEVWFAKIERDVIARGVFACVPDLQRRLMRYITRVRAAWHVGRQLEWRRNLSAAGLDLEAGFAGEDTAAPVHKFVRADLCHQVRAPETVGPKTPAALARIKRRGRVSPPRRLRLDHLAPCDAHSNQRPTQCGSPSFGRSLLANLRLARFQELDRDLHQNPSHDRGA